MTKRLWASVLTAALVLSTGVPASFAEGNPFPSIKPPSGPAPQAAEAAKDYMVGVDDILDIGVIKPETIAYTVTVSPDGAITFPYIGNVRVQGHTLSTIQDEVQKRLADY